MGRALLLSQEHQQGAGSAAQHLELEPGFIWDLSITGGSSTATLQHCSVPTSSINVCWDSYCELTQKHVFLL